MSSSATRRSSDIVHRLILEAATALFSESGFDGTSMREIARRAEVAEPLLYRHFESKECLFREAVFSPVRHFFSNFTATWRTSLDEDGSAPGSTEYMSGLYDALRANRHLLLTHLTSDLRDRSGSDASRREDPSLVGLLNEIEDLVRREQGRSLRASLDPALAVRFTFALCLSMALFGDLMFSADHAPPDHDRLVGEMGAYLTYATVRDDVAGQRRRSPDER